MRYRNRSSPATSSIKGVEKTLIDGILDYCYDRKVPDSRGRIICGHTLKDGEKVVIVDDLMSTGQTMCERIERLKEVANIDVIAVVVIADLTDEDARAQGMGAGILEEKYGAKVYSIISEKDIRKILDKIH